MPMSYSWKGCTAGGEGVSDLCSLGLLHLLKLFKCRSWGCGVKGKIPHATTFPNCKETRKKWVMPELTHGHIPINVMWKTLSLSLNELHYPHLFCSEADWTASELWFKAIPFNTSRGKKVPGIYWGTNFIFKKPCKIPVHIPQFYRGRS